MNASLCSLRAGGTAKERSLFGFRSSISLHLLSSRVGHLGQLDLATLSMVSAGFTVCAALAAWVPARRATLIYPVQALRFE
jgi:ABC-type antimicrobial peptide transport system permease subunit